MTPKAVEAFEEARGRNLASGDAPVLPAPGDASTCVSRTRVGTWWKTAERRAGLEPKRGRGWHSLRRKFASDLVDLPLKVLCDLGGWREAKTVLRCYQHTDEVQLRTALDSRPRKVGLRSNLRESNSGNRLSESRK